MINEHIKNILQDGELLDSEVCAFFAHTTNHGTVKGKTQTKEIIKVSNEFPNYIINLIDTSNRSVIILPTKRGTVC